MPRLAGLKRKIGNNLSNSTGHKKQRHVAPSKRVASKANDRTVPLGGGDIAESNTDDSGNEELEGSHKVNDSGLDLQGEAAPSHAATNEPAHTSTYKVPTTAELTQLKEATQLYKSASFKLKIEAFLPMVSPKKNTTDYVNSVLRRIHAHLTSLPAIEPRQPVEAAQELAGSTSSKSSVAGKIRVLYSDPGPTRETKWKVAFHKPEKVTVVGSWANGLSMVKRYPHNKKKFITVDLAVEMPKDLIREKDYLDNKIFHKKAYYLAVLASSFLSPGCPLGNGLSIHYSCPENNLRRTSLVVCFRPDNAEPTQNPPPEVLVRILVTLAADHPFPIKRMVPSICNIRPRVLQLGIDASPPSPETNQSPTPSYNNDIMLMTTPVPFLLSSYAASKEVPSFRDCAKLLGIWASRRGYGGASQSYAETDAAFFISGFEDACVTGGGSWWSTLLILLIWGKVDSQAEKSKKGGTLGTIGRGLSSYQMFRAVMDFLANYSFIDNDPIVSRGNLNDASIDSTTYLAGARSPCVLGPSTLFNFLENVPSGSLKMLQHDARLTLQTLDAPIGHSDTESVTFKDTFDATFVTRLNENVATRFDFAVSIDLRRSTLPPPSHPDCPSRRSLLLNRLNDVAMRALGSRAQICVVCVPAAPASACFSVETEQQLHKRDTPVVTLGVILSSESLGLVDHGPLASDVAACAEFREFWGEKSEMRRFNDGRIVESVVWSLDGDCGRGLAVSDERARILERIIQYALERHLGITPDRVTVLGNDAVPTDSVLAFPSHRLAPYYQLPFPIPPTSTTFSMSQRLLHACYDRLLKRLKTLKSVPLSLDSGQPISEYLRYTSPFPPIPINVQRWDSVPAVAKFVPVVDVVLRFERSSRWPGDLEAIQKVKMALLEAIGHELSSASGEEGILLTSISLAPNALPIEDNVALDVLTQSGFAFRFHAQSSLEESLLHQKVQNTPDDKKHAMRDVLENHLLRFVRKSQHHNAIHSLQHRYLTFGHTARLLKRWFAAHWLLPHFSVELIELICAFIYINNGAEFGLHTPHSGVCAFARALEFLAEWDWEAVPLMVPLHGAAASSDFSEGTRFLSPETTKSMQDEFFRYRSTNPDLSKAAWCIPTEEDLSGHVWTRGINAMLASRVQVIATAAVKLMKESLALGQLLLKPLFLHPISDYDFLIHIDPLMVPRNAQHINLDWGLMPHKRSDQGIHRGVLLNFDPLRSFCDDIQHIYGDSVALFYDPYGGVKIGGVWNPSLREPKPHQVLLGFSPEPTKSNSSGPKQGKLTVVLNVEAILAEVQRLGGDLVERIEVLKP
ncbi:Nrap protein [Cantharellus anzutake]|uniref:Nrap protein n=1 Tax=Cantharellus anzutake TaxID=1750568 RepID=UPI001907CFD3|nr:Nrap protein [Cantharellus anzutake]KAF8343082.1 Nrap protein [Cantharellus anzutake]